RFFFQAEDGIRDRNVTGVQTCALPIFQKVREDFGLTRLDYNISSKDSFSANYLIQDGENDVPSPNPNFFRPLPLRTQLLSLQETHVFSAALLNTASAGFSRGHIKLGAFPAVPIPPELSFFP